MRVLFEVLFIASPLFAGAALISYPDRGYNRGHRLGGATGWPRATKNFNAEYIHPTLESDEEKSNEETFGQLNLPNDDEFGGYSGSIEVEVLPPKSSNYENDHEKNDGAINNEDDIDFDSLDQDDLKERFDDLFGSMEKDDQEKQDLRSQEIDSLQDKNDNTDEFFDYRSEDKTGDYRNGARDGFSLTNEPGAHICDYICASHGNAEDRILIVDDYVCKCL